MSWKLLSDFNEWEQIISRSHLEPQIVFKHSTRCSISLMAKSRVEKTLKKEDGFYLLDLLQHRNISNTIAADLGITHESPQVLVISNGTCVYHESHTAIEYNDIIKSVEKSR